MKINNQRKIRSLSKRDIEAIKGGQLISQQLRNFIFASISLVLVIILLSPFWPSRRYWVPIHLRNRVPSNFDEYWSKLPVSELAMGLVLLGITALDYLLPWLDIQIGKKYIHRGRIQNKKKCLGWYLLKINITKKSWICVPNHFYQRVKVGESIQITRSLLRTKNTYSKVKEKTHINGYSIE